MKKILYFFPFNPIEKKDGSKTRALELLKYFKEKGFELDFVYEKNIDNNAAHDVLLKDMNLANNIWSIKRRPNTFSFHYLIYKFHKLFLRKKTSLNNLFFDKQFNKILKNNTYDYIIISYATYAGLINRKHNLKNATTIIDTHDFLTAQIQDKNKLKIGQYFQDEINRLRQFDEVWAISNDELYVFSQFVSNVKLVPFTTTDAIKGIEHLNRKFDVLYVASENPHNLKAAKWFFSEVYPLLEPTLRIAVVGKICKHIGVFENVTKFNFIDDLSEIYNTSKITICPMLSGTGVKIKVIESLFFGLPVVTNYRGIDGLPNKTRNGCFVTNSHITFAGYIANLLENKALYNIAKTEATHFFNEHFSKKIIYNILDESFK